MPPKLTKPDGEPKTEVRDTFVVVENYGGSKDQPAEVALDSAQCAGKTVYIQNCEFAQVNVKGAKIKTLNVENCKKLCVILDKESCDPAAEHAVGNSQNVEIQCEGDNPKHHICVNSKEITLTVPGLEQAQKCVFKSILAENHLLQYFDADFDQNSVMVPPYTSVTCEKGEWVVKGDTTVM